MIEIKKEDIFSVSDVNRIIKSVLEELSALWVEGEVANFTPHSSGHIYFSLKDKNSTLRCAFFRQYNIDSGFYPQDGDKVLCFGKIDVYGKTGTYQLLVRQMMPAGIGDLQLKFLALKEKLSEEGLFDVGQKREIPEYPDSVGIITSPTGAAYQDIKNILTRRFPCRIYLYPADVQGEKAPRALIEGLRYFNEVKPVDTIILGRGGGSQEDLFCFNDENLARAIFDSEIPVISAVGHEIDFTIADFVADLRAPTPSAAAELAVPDKKELLERLRNYRKQLSVKTSQQLLHFKHILRSSEKTLHQKHPRALLFKYQQQLDELVAAFTIKIRYLAELRARSDYLKDKLVYLSTQKAAEGIHRKEMQLESRKNRLINAARRSAEEKRTELNERTHQLNRLSPYEALKRGYAIVRQEQKIINSVEKIDINNTLEVKLNDGNCQCTVKKIEKNRSLS